MKKHFSFIILMMLSGVMSSAFSRDSNPWKDDYKDIAGMENYQQWGAYNVHDPAIFKVGDSYYMYSTDAIYRERRREAQEKNIPIGYIQVRSSKDLVHWKFEQWAFPEIPAEAKEWVLANSNQKGATNIWAPYPVKVGDIFRLYYCVSAFGMQTSYIGLAESSSPLGPWTQKGAVVKTKTGDKMNAIDPSIITDPATGEMWMHYGSYFGGLYAVELNPATGFTKSPDDQGKSIARRANFRKDNIEAPEIMYHPGFKKYYLFVSYDPLMTTYNVRVGRSDKIDGPFLDFFGKDMADTTNNYPILTYPYQFKNHPGWAGTAHCGIISDEKGNFFMAHQGRLSPEHHLMVLHVREMKWTKSGWPVVSPERFAGTTHRKINKKDIPGKWEIIRINDGASDRQLEFGQILWGENMLRRTEQNISSVVELKRDGNLSGENVAGKWVYSIQKGVELDLKNESISNLIIFAGHDWENGCETILFTGLDATGRSVWGKKVK